MGAVAPWNYPLHNSAVKLAPALAAGNSLVLKPAEAEGVALANDSHYGLAASLWTADLGLAHRLCDSLQAGTVTVNGVDAVSPQTPFGGMKQSGIGRDYELAGMRKYMALKTRWIHY